MVVAGIAVLDDVAELGAVGTAPSGVGIEDDVALRGHPLELVRERVSVSRMRAAVDVEDQRILLRGVEAGRLLDPGGDLQAVEAGVADLLGRGQVEPGEELGVEVGEPLRGAPGEVERGRGRRTVVGRAAQVGDLRAVGRADEGGHVLVAGRDRRDLAGGSRRTLRGWPVPFGRPCRSGSSRPSTRPAGSGRSLSGGAGRR